MFVSDTHQSAPTSSPTADKPPTAKIGRMNLIDSHCHLDFPAFDHDRAKVLQRCRELGIGQIIIPGVVAQHWGRIIQLCRSSHGHTPQLYPALGMHPLFMDQHHDNDLAQLSTMIESDRPVAIGEIGLDFYHKESDRPGQQRLFEQQLMIAREANLPAILHIRKAHDQALTTLKQLRPPGGIVHAFSGSLQQATQYIGLGFKLGFGGMLTYERSTRLRALAQALPLESIVLETDAPDMTVAAHRGERNSPEYLPDCLNALAELRGEPAHLIANQTSHNVQRLFNLPPG